jgi:hypothetical protein
MNLVPPVVICAASLSELRAMMSKGSSITVEGGASCVDVMLVFVERAASLGFAHGAVAVSTTADD